MLIAYKNNKPYSKFERISRRPCRFIETHLESGETSTHLAEVSHFLGHTLLQAFRLIEKTYEVKIRKIKTNVP